MYEFDEVEAFFFEQEHLPASRKVQTVLLQASEEDVELKADEMLAVVTSHLFSCTKTLAGP